MSVFNLLVKLTRECFFIEIGHSFLGISEFFHDGRGRIWCLVPILNTKQGRYQFQAKTYPISRATVSMMTSSNGNIFHLNSPVLGEFPAQKPVTRRFDVFFDLRLNKRLSQQSWSWWFNTLPLPLWRHSNDTHLYLHRTAKDMFQSYFVCLFVPSIYLFVQCQIKMLNAVKFQARVLNKHLVLALWQLVYSRGHGPLRRKLYQI